MKNVCLFICCFMLGMSLLLVPSCSSTQSGPSETVQSTTAETGSQTAALAPTLESVPLSDTGGRQSSTAMTDTESEGTPTPPSEDQSKQSARAETLSRLKRYKEESDSLLKAAASYTDVSYHKRYFSPFYYVCFYCDADKGDYITENNTQRIKECEGMALDNVFDLLPQPLITCYTRYSLQDFSAVPQASSTIKIPMVFEVKTLSLTEDGKILEITFTQEYESVQPSTVVGVAPKGFVIKTVNEYAFDEIVQLYK